MDFAILQLSRIGKVPSILKLVDSYESTREFNYHDQKGLMADSRMGPSANGHMDKEVGRSLQKGNGKKASKLYDKSESHVSVFSRMRVPLKIGCMVGGTLLLVTG
ncbi:unnamed protein product [Cuscuta campestris]|uniref:Uncharacterized protein n=1 Tax=Cuscuta campestris TaxID=132261 RepID=A0A484KWA0_9ASTE|nr:unnamed protein product [Cuscuta campestris]